MVEPVDFGVFFDSPHLMLRTLNPDLVKSCRSSSSDAGKALMNRALSCYFSVITKVMLETSPNAQKHVPSKSQILY